VPSVVSRPQMPGSIETSDPSHGKPPTGDGWAHEVKWDSYRGQAHRRNRSVKISTRRGNDWSKTFALVAEALSWPRAEDAIVDGEVVALTGGLPDLRKLRRQLGEPSPDIVYQVFDLLWHDGEDLRSEHYVVRRNRLREPIDKGGAQLQ